MDRLIRPFVADFTQDPPAATWPSAVLRAGDRSVIYALRVSRRARFLRVTVSPSSGVVLTITPRTSRAQIAEFLDEHRGWIFRQLDRMSTIAARVPRRWPYGPTLPYRGDEHVVVLRERPQGHWIERTPAAELVVSMADPAPDRARLLLKRWYIEEASRWLIDRATVLAEPLDVAWRQLRIGASEHRWGSCSAAGSLCFNYRLVMDPPAVLDYVVLHELCHRREFNHSPRFWSLVAEHCPHYRDSRAWLKTVGPHIGL